MTRNGAAFESYTFDSNDNRLTKTTAAGTTTYAHDDQDRLLSAVGPEGAESWLYDANGDLLNRTESSGTTSFDYDTTGQLLSVTKPDGDVVSYELDAGNKRAVKKLNGIVQRKWLYGGGLLPVAEYDANDNLVAVFNGGYMVKKRCDLPPVAGPPGLGSVGCGCRDRCRRSAIELRPLGRGPGGHKPRVPAVRVRGWAP